MRFRLSLTVGFLLLLILSSCNQDSLKVSVVPYDAVVLHASYVGGYDTKTQFGNFTTTHSFAQVYWSQEDSISVFHSVAGSVANDRFRSNQTDGLTSDFYPDPPINAFTADAVLGLYPYNSQASADTTALQIMTVLPSEQTAVDYSFDPSAMLAVGLTSAAEQESVQMSFYNVCSGLCFTLKEGNPVSYSKITIEGNSGEDLGGDVVISLSDPEEPEVSATASSSKVITLLPPLDVTGAPSGFRPGIEYSIVLLPGEFPSGFKMKFYDGQNNVLATCVCTSYIVFRRGRFGKVNDIDNPAKLAAIRDGEDLSLEKGPANCYIVSSPGSYKIPSVRGNDIDDVITSIDHVAVLWETANTASAPAVGSIVQDNVTYNRGFIYFNIPDNIHNGNALIAAYHGNDIVWSWHIWVCRGYNPDETAQLLAGKPSPMLDRNIGALSSLPGPLSNGLFYQWGRKDPFPGATQSYMVETNGGTLAATTAGPFQKVSGVDVNATMDYAIANPTKFITASNANWLRVNAVSTLWSDQKTIYDPCPPGWRVPHAYYVENKVHITSKEAWADVTTYPSNYAPYEYGTYFALEQSTVRAWYPCNGFLESGTGDLYRVGQYALYWSCSPSSGNSYGMSIMMDYVGKISVNPIQYGKYRAEGHSVRCIAE